MSDLTEKMTVIRETRETYERLLIAENRIAELEGVCREVYEVWAGSEGIPMPKTGGEAYLLQLVEQMRNAAKKGLKPYGKDRIAELERLNAVALDAMKYVAVEYESQVLINAVEILEGAGK